jgi:hypothetical protein
MKWKRSRKAQQESKNNKDSHSSGGSSSEDKREPRERSTNQTKSEKVATNLSGSSFSFSKNSDQNSHLPTHPGLLHQRHLNSLPGSSKDLIPSHGDEGFISRQPPSVFSEADDMIWRVV